jgi:hypothetical protein
MKNNTIEDIEEYAKDSQTTQKPTDQNYAEGVKVGWTLPAKWWNWLMNAFTKRFRETKATVDSMYEELSNLMWPLVPGENETNDQCKSRIQGSMSELSERISTNTENISANTTAISNETAARKSAIEQEQLARTQQDGVLDSKITSLNNTVSANTSKINTNTGNISANTTAISNETAARKSEDTAIRSLITQTQAEIYNSIITHNIYRTDEIGWTTLFNDLKNKGCPTGLHIGDIVYTVNSYNNSKRYFLVVDINYFKNMVLVNKAPINNHIVLMSLANTLSRFSSDESNTSYLQSEIYSKLKDKTSPYFQAVIAEIDSSLDSSEMYGCYPNLESGYDAKYGPLALHCDIAQLVGTDLQGLFYKSPLLEYASLMLKYSHSVFNKQFKLFKEESFLAYRAALKNALSTTSDSGLPDAADMTVGSMSGITFPPDFPESACMLCADADFPSTTAINRAPLVTIRYQTLRSSLYYPEVYIVGHRQ